MPTRILFGVLATSCILAAPASAESISCPLTQADRQIANPLPPEWRVTPYAQRLTGARIAESGALQTLICDYGEAGSIQRAAPREARCTARTGGFDCTGPITEAKRTVAVPTAPVVHRSGSITLRHDPPARPQMDLDSGAGTSPSTPSLPRADFTLIVSGPAAWEMQSDSAKVWAHNGTAPLGKEGCAAGRDTSVYGPHYRVMLPAAGRYACYITDEGRVGELMVTGYGTTVAGRVQTVTLRYTTWPR
jgi:hypothetical protein